MTLKADYINLLRIAKSKKKPSLMDLNGYGVDKVSINAKGMVRVVFLNKQETTFTQAAAEKVLVKVFDRAEREAYKHRSLADTEADSVIHHPGKWAGHWEAQFKDDPVTA